MSHCWTCGSEHDPDDACRSAAAYSSDFFDDAGPVSGPGPAFVAQYVGEDACCGAGIWPGDWIRADGHGGWIHNDCKENE